MRQWWQSRGVDPEPQITDDVSAFKLAFRRLAAGVSVITALHPDGRPAGFTATSLASLAADPPMATFNMARRATAWPAIEQTGHVLIHLLGVRNRAVAETLSLGQTYAGQHGRELALARMMTDLLPSAELVRFATSGTAIFDPITGTPTVSGTGPASSNSVLLVVSCNFTVLPRGN